MATAASQPGYKGLDLGTSRIVLSTLNGEKVKFTPQLNAFVELPYTKMTERMLSSEGILHQVDGERIFAYGNRSDEFAKFLNGDARIGTGEIAVSGENFVCAAWNAEHSPGQLAGPFLQENAPQAGDTANVCARRCRAGMRSTNYW